MFDLYELIQYPAPFPRRLVGVYTEPEALIRDLCLTKSELDDLIDGNVICKQSNRDRYYELELSPLVMRKLEIEHMASMNPDGLNETEIADMTSVKRASVCLCLQRAYTRLEKEGVLREFLRNIREYRIIRDDGRFECTLTITENKRK